MLALRPNCECCDRDLPPDSRDAMICTFECTFCKDCVDGPLKGACPNCGGEFVRRPIRPARDAGEVSGLDRAEVETGRMCGGMILAKRRNGSNAPSPLAGEGIAGVATNSIG
jgi:uncharacterized protein